MHPKYENKGSYSEIFSFSKLHDILGFMQPLWFPIYCLINDLCFHYCTLFLTGLSPRMVIGSSLIIFLIAILLFLFL